MTFRLVVRSAAKADIRDAKRWYEERRKGLGKRFIAAIEATMAAVSAAPGRFPETRPNFRRALVAGFPYKVVFELTPPLIVVVAVYHQKRGPESLDQRLDEHEGEQDA